MTARDEWSCECPSCAGAVKEREAAQGLRCVNCLDTFDKRYPFRSETSPELCRPCERALNAPRADAPRYGTGR
jgi:reverse gyrase